MSTSRTSLLVLGMLTSCFALFTLLPSAHLFHSASHFSLRPCPFFNRLGLVFPPTVASAVDSRRSSSKLELWCLYSEWSQIRSVEWTYQNKSRKLHLLSNRPGSVVAVLPRPISSDTAGNYTCTLRLSNGQTVWAAQTVALPAHGKRTPPLGLACALAPSSQLSLFNSAKIMTRERPPCLARARAAERSVVRSRQPQFICRKAPVFQRKSAPDGRPTFRSACGHGSRPLREH